jgi:hypothetical protein
MASLSSARFHGQAAPRFPCEARFRYIDGNKSGPLAAAPMAPQPLVEPEG